MRPITSLIKINLKVNFGISVLRHKLKHQKDKRIEFIASAIAILVAICSLIFMYTFILMGLYRQSMAINQPGLIIAYGFVVTQLMTFIFGIIYIMSAFYFSNDLSILVPLPLTAGDVMLAKFITILANEYLVVLPMLLPPIIIYGINEIASPIFGIKAVILIIFAPIIPLAIATIIIMILMRFINLSRHKDALTIIGGVLSIFIVIALNVVSQNMTGTEEDMLFKAQLDLLEIVGKKFPPSLWASRGLVYGGTEGLLNFLVFIVVSLLLFVGLIALANRVFYKGLLAGQEASKKKVHRPIKDKSIKRHHPVFSLFMKEWKLFLRTPIYAVNGLIGIILMPILILLPIITEDSELQELQSLIHAPGAEMVITLIGIALIIFTATMTLIASTAISREGSTFWISKIIPISPREQIFAKLLHAMAIALIGIFITGSAYALILNVSPARLLVMLLIGSLASMAINILSLIIDVIKPKLDWDNPQEAVKKNINGLYGMLISFLIIGLLGFVVFLLFDRGEMAIYSAISVLLIILNFLALKLLFKKADKTYRKLEL